VEDRWNAALIILARIAVQMSYEQTSYVVKLVP